MSMTRRTFLTASTAAVALPAAAALPADVTPAGAAMLRRIDGGVHDSFPAADPGVVFEIVSKAHFDADACRAICEKRPELAKASIDLGFGDWESGLGAASHMGRRDIAELLIEHGARPNLFTHAMLGQLDVVKAAVAAQPGTQRIHGPHGITLLQHARNGGEAAQHVVAYLTALGDADENATSLGIGDDDKQRYVGRYVFGPGDDDAFDVLTNRRGNLAIKRGDRFSRVLNRVEEHGFAPAGAMAVRVRFTVRQGPAVSLTIHDPHPLVTALRQNS